MAISKLFSRNSSIVILALAGCLACTLSFAYKSDDIQFVILNFNGFGFAISCSLVVSAIVAYMLPSNIESDPKKEAITEEWGLSAIYETRSLMNVECDKAQAKAQRCIDVAAFGLTSWRQKCTPMIEDNLKRGVKIRILCPDPDSLWVKQRSLDEDSVPESIPNSIRKLIEWTKTMRQHGAIELRMYSGLPLDFYFRVDDKLFTGPYLYGIQSQQTVSFEYDSPKLMFGTMTNHFETVWKQATDMMTMNGKETGSEFLDEKIKIL